MFLIYWIEFINWAQGSCPTKRLGGGSLSSLNDSSSAQEKRWQRKLLTQRKDASLKFVTKPDDLYDLEPSYKKNFRGACELWRQGGEMRFMSNRMQKKIKFTSIQATSSDRTKIC